METLATLAGKVGNGAALLDQLKPGWADEIDLPTLDLRNGSSCVLGQTYGSYYEALNRLASDAGLGTDGIVTDETATEYGFFTMERDDDRIEVGGGSYNEPSYLPAWEALTMLWSGAIAARRVA